MSRKFYENPLLVLKGFNSLSDLLSTFPYACKMLSKLFKNKKKYDRKLNHKMNKEDIYE